MDIEIKKLTPELTEDYLHFFDVTPHDDDTPGSKCYCVCWCSADHRIETDFSSQDKRRELARQYVKNGVIQGYLAYYGDRVVGWCNANTKSECLHCISWQRNMQSVDTDDKNLKIKSIFCFVIAPDMQRKGIATMLLKQVCDDAAQDGFDIVESYPKKEFMDKAHDFMGPSAMYEKLGFTIYKETKKKYGFTIFKKAKDEIVMRKALSKTDFSKHTPCGGCCEECDHFKTNECKGCLATGGMCIHMWQKSKGICNVCKCCQEHNVSFCGLCNDFPCEWLTKWFDGWNKDGINNLARLRDKYTERKI